jgi:hypothetical protein
VRGVVGAVLILLAIFLIGPIALFFGGGIWSAVVGFFATDDAERRAAQPSESA